MSRYLHVAFIQSALARGRSVEQQLVAGAVGDDRTIRWIEIAPVSHQRVEVRLHEVIDIGNEEYLDVYGFPPVGSNTSTVVESRSFASLDDALPASVKMFGASLDRFVNAGMIQDEYRDSLSSR